MSSGSLPRWSDAVGFSSRKLCCIVGACQRQYRRAPLSVSQSKVHINEILLALTWLVNAALKRPSALPCFPRTWDSLASALPGFDIARRLDKPRGLEPQAHWHARSEPPHVGSGAYMLAHVSCSKAHLGRAVVPIACIGRMEDAALPTHSRVTWILYPGLRTTWRLHLTAVVSQFVLCISHSVTWTHMPRSCRQSRGTFRRTRDHDCPMKVFEGCMIAEKIIKGCLGELSPPHSIVTDDTAG